MFLTVASGLFYLFVANFAAEEKEEVQFKLGVILREQIDHDYLNVLERLEDDQSVRTLFPNRSSSTLFKVHYVLNVDYSNSASYMQLFEGLCELMKDGGIVGIITVPNDALTDMVEGMVHPYMIPFLRLVAVDRNGHYPNNAIKFEYTFQFYPDCQILNAAFLDVINYLEWSDVFIVYHTLNDLKRLRSFISAEQMGTNISFSIGKVGDNMLDVMRQAKELGYKHIFINVPDNMTEQLLSNAMQVGMISDEYTYMLTSLMSSSLNLDQFIHNGVQMFMFDLRTNESVVKLNVNNENKLNVGFFHDAVRSFLGGMRGLEKYRENNKKIEIRMAKYHGFKPSTKSQPSYSNFSHFPHLFKALSTYMLLDLKFGYTGNFTFYKLMRSDLAMNIKQLDKTGKMNKVGHWINHNHEQQKKPNDFVLKEVRFAYSYSRTLTEWFLLKPKDHLNITTIEERPYVMKKDNSEELVGFCVDLLNRLQQDLGFDFTLSLVKDGRYGEMDVNGTWDGMIGEIVKGDVQLAVAPLTINSKRTEAVEFTTPFLNLGISVLFRVPESQKPRIFSFLNPLSLEIWGFTALSVLIVTLFLFCTARISPYEWRPRVRCHNRIALPDDVLVNRFTMANSLWFTLSTLFRGASDDGPRAISTRLLGGIWWIFTLVMVSAYTANLAAVLAVTRLFIPLDSINDLSNQSHIKYGAIEGGSTLQFFRESDSTSHQAINRNMESNKQWLVQNNSDGVRRVLNENYAYLMESTSLEYEVNQNCSLTQVGGVLGLRGYAIAVSKDHGDWSEKMSAKILEYSEKGVLEHFKRKWWKYSGKNCDQSFSGLNDFSFNPAKATMKGGKNPMTIKNVAGVFLILAAGLALGILVGFLEFLWKRAKGMRRAPLHHDIASELCFAVKQDRFRAKKVHVDHHQCSDCRNAARQSLLMEPAVANSFRLERMGVDNRPSELAPSRSTDRSLMPPTRIN